MKVLVIEDEPGVAQNLCNLLQEVEEEIEVLAVVESVRDAVHWLEHHPEPDLGFFDIRIADGDSFDIFAQTSINFPVIFTTAYDEYALKAFKVNSVDYLLKPINKSALKTAVTKYRSIYKKGTALNQDLLNLIEKLQATQPKKFRKSLLVYFKDKIVPVKVEDVAYFYLENESVNCQTHRNEHYVLDQSLDKIELQLDPETFFRANRQFLISRKAVRAARQHTHRKLKLELYPFPKSEVLISKTKATQFKKWLEM